MKYRRLPILLAVAAVAVRGEPSSIVKLDFGTKRSPVAPGFTAVTPEMHWQDGARIGWLTRPEDRESLIAVDAPVDPAPKPNAHSGRMDRPKVYTNALSQDHVESAAKARLRVVVPAGRYRVWAVLGAAGPGKDRRNASRVWDTHVTCGEAKLSATFPGMYETRTWVGSVISDGVLEFGVTTRNKWLLNALVVVPEEAWAQTHAAVLAAYEQDIYQLPQSVLAKWQHRPHVDDSPMPRFTPKEKERGMVVYHRNYLDCVWPNTVPLRREMDPVIKAFASQGEYEPLTFTILPLRDLEGLRVEFSALTTPLGERIDADHIEVRYVRFMWVKPNYTADGVYYRAPDVLMPFRAPRKAKAKENLRVWATVFVPPKTPGGVYTGTATVFAGTRAVHTVPVVFRVLPIVLEKDQRTTYALYYRHPYDMAGRAPDAFSRDWYLRRAELEHRDLAAHGMNGITLSCWAGAPQDGKWKFDFDALAAKIELLRRHGMERPLPVSFPTFTTYGKYVRTPRRSHLRGVEVPPPEFFRTVTQMVERIEAERRIRQWPEFLYYPVDEPSTQPSSVAFMVEVLKAIKRVPGARTYVTADPVHEQFDPMRPYVDVWCCQPFNPDRETVLEDMKKHPGREYWCYPNHVNGENDHTPVTGARMTYGFGFWRSGFRALIPWIYKHETGNPWNYLDSTYMDFFNRTADDGDTIPVAMYEAYREGIDDGRYLTTLQHWIRRAREAGRNDLAERAARDLEFLRDSINVQTKYKYTGMWDPEAFDVYRWMIAQHILELQGALAWR